MKGLVISPGKGTTVSLKLQKYFNRAEATAAGLRERGTQAKYVGSFNSSLDPRRLDGVERIGPADAHHGVTLTGVGFEGNPVELDADDIREIREWLLANGSWTKVQKSTEEFRAEQQRLKAVERSHLEARLRAELMAQLRPQLQAELLKDIEARREHPIAAAISAVKAAGAAVRDEANRLVSEGHRLTTRRGKTPGGSDAP